MKFLFVHGWAGFSLAEWCLREAVARNCREPVGFRGIELQPGDMEDQDYFFQVFALFRPDFIGFSCFDWNTGYYLEMAAGARALEPGCKIVLGGPQINSTRQCDEILGTRDAIDFIIRGESEHSLPLLLDGSSSHESLDQIGGLSYRSNDRIVHQPVDRDASWSREKIFHWNNRELSELLGQLSVVSYETIRGCRYKCSYCQYPFHNVDMLDLDMVIDELTYLCEMSIPHIRICDAHFGGTQARAKSILRKLAKLKHRSSFKIYVDLTQIDEEYLKLVEDARAEITSIGIQTTHPGSLKLIKRPRLHRLDKAIAMVLDKFPETPADLIVGLPGDSFETVRRSFLDVLDLGFSRANVFRLAAFPGTPLTDDLQNLMKGAVLCGSGSQVILSEHFPRDVSSRLGRLIAAFEIALALSEVRHRLGAVQSVGKLLDHLTGLDGEGLLELHDLVFRLPPGSLLKSWPWIGEIIASLAGWSSQHDEALITDLLRQQYHKSIRLNLTRLLSVEKDSVEHYDCVVYEFRNGALFTGTSAIAVSKSIRNPMWWKR